MSQSKSNSRGKLFCIFTQGDVRRVAEIIGITPKKNWKDQTVIEFRIRLLTDQVETVASRSEILTIDEVIREKPFR